MAIVDSTWASNYDWVLPYRSNTNHIINNGGVECCL